VKAEVGAPTLAIGLAPKEVALSLVIFGSALALGASHATVLCVVAVAALVSLALAWWNAESFSPRNAATTLLLVSLGLAAFTLFQSIPLPRGLLGALAPQNFDVWNRALTPLHEDGPTWAPLSLDPIATHIEVLRGIVYTLVFLAAVRIASGRRGAFILSTAIMITGLALGVAALLHPAFGAEKVFGIYRPEQQISARHIAPLLNPNTLAAYLNIAFALSLAQAISPRPQLPRYASAAAAFFLVVVQVWVASRGGALSMVVAAVVVVVLSRASRSVSTRSFRADIVALGGFTAVALIMILLAATEDAWKELNSTDTSKIHLFENVLATVKRFPIFGMGRGAFESVFPADKVGNGFFVFTHPENVVLQWATEWGVIVTLAALIAIAWSLRPRVVLARGQFAVGAWGALVAVAIHNLVDFSSEVPGVVIALCVCAAIVVGGSSGSGARSRIHDWGKDNRRLVLASALATACAIALVLPGIGDDLYSDRTALHALANDPNVSRVDFERAARDAMLRHPAEPYLSYMGALRASRARDTSVIPWAERGLERAQVYGPLHILIARELRATRPAQARVEYRYALIERVDSSWDLTKEELPLVHSLDDVLEIVPPDDIYQLQQFDAALARSLPSTVWEIEDEILKRDPNDGITLTRRADAALRDLLDGDAASWCADRASCVTKALDATGRVLAVAPNECAGYVVRARVLQASGDIDHALSELKSAADHAEDSTVCLTARVDLARHFGSYEQTTAAVDDLVRRGCAGADDCANNFQFAASVEAERSDYARALTFSKKAYEASPECDACLASAASYASQMGLHAEALDEYSRLAKRHPEVAAYAQSESAERNALMSPK
jgi:O-antigen ligase/tetratricopeptide (TPR) repeat protein